jgi:hypothetical protein
LRSSFVEGAWAHSGEAQDQTMSTVGDALPSGGPEENTDAQWKQWALAVFGGNDVRATAAAQAAAVARRAGASSDQLFASAREAYNTATLPETAIGKTASWAGPHTNAADCIVRPSGRGILGLSLVGILVAGIGAVIVRSGIASVVPVIVVAAVVMAIWYGLSVRSSVRVAGDSVYVQGVLLRREFRRLDIRQITVQPRSRQLGMINGPMRGQFLASFVGEDFTHLFELRQGAWTRGDVDRIGSAIGVQVIDEATPSVT